jgi:enamine deaminase RidA (YjgF/YER057c/UK114 family)
MQTLNPDGWPRPKGFSNGVAAEGRQVYVAGQVGWNPAAESFETDDFAAQVRQALENTVAVLAAAGAGPEHVTRMTWYVTDIDEYMAAVRDVGAAYREVIGPNYPAMALVQVVRLVDPRARVEIETTAVVPTA